MIGRRYEGDFWGVGNVYIDLGGGYVKCDFFEKFYWVVYFRFMFFIVFIFNEKVY